MNVIKLMVVALEGSLTSRSKKDRWSHSDFENRLVK